MGAGDGVRAAVGAEVAAVAGAVADARAPGEQLGMFALPTRFDGKVAQEQLDKAARGRGRPPGAQNRSTKDMRDFMRAQGVDPLFDMVRWAQHTPETLAKELKCSVAAAYDRLQDLRKELAPYFYGRVAPVDADGQAVPMFLMQVGGGGSVAIAGGAAPWLTDPRRVVEVEQNQSLSEPAASASHGAPSHGGDK